MSDHPATPTAFTRLACGACPDLDRFLVALAAEFRPVDLSGTLLALDRLALDVGLVDREPPAVQLAALRGALHDLVACPARDIEAVALDRVVAQRRGHPAVLAAAYVLVGRRCGIPLAPLLAADRMLVAHLGAGVGHVLDPALGGASVSPDELPDEARWRCPHQVAYHVLSALIGGALDRGDVGTAVKAAELRLALPCDADSRTVLELELGRIRSRLN